MLLFIKDSFKLIVISFNIVFTYLRVNSAIKIEIIDNSLI